MTDETSDPPVVDPTKHYPLPPVPMNRQEN